MAGRSRKSTGGRRAANPRRPARATKSKKGSVPTATGAVETTHNETAAADQANFVLTPEQGMALHHRHTGQYKKELDRKKKANADFKNVCKRIKAEGGSISLIKMQLMEPEALERHIRDTVGDLRIISEYNAMPIGAQLELVDKPDRTPGDVRAFKAGRVVGMQGGDRSPPFAPNLPQASKWLQGYDEGQEISRDIMKKKLGKPDAELVKAGSAKAPKTPRKTKTKEPDKQQEEEVQEGSTPESDRGGESTWIDDKTETKEATTAVH